MNEPERIGLTETAHSMLEELLAELNPAEGEGGEKLIKFDLYKLAVAMEFKKSTQPALLSETSRPSLRVLELDRDGSLYAVLKSSGVVPEGSTVYGYIERLAEAGVRTLHQDFQQTGELPWEQYFA